MNKRLSVGYCRVSTKKQEKVGLSLEAQEDYIREWVRTNSHDLVKVFKVQESCGDRERRHLMKTFNYCLENGIKYILITDTDRWTRDRNLDMEFRKFIEKNNLLVYIIRERKTIPQFNSAMDEFAHNIQTDASDYVKKAIKEKTLEGIKKKLEKGEYPGSLPLGYKSIRKTDKSPHRIVQTEDAPKVKRLLESFNTGRFTIRQAIRFNKDIGLKPRRKDKFTKGALAKIIKNKFYYGEFEWDGKIYENKTEGFEPLITKELWKQNQEILKKRQKNLKEKQGRGKGFKFNNLLTCGKCGRAIFGERFSHEVKYKTKNGIKVKKYSYPTRYHCTKGLWYTANGYFIPPEYIDKHVDKENLLIKKAITYIEEGEEKVWLKEGTPIESHICDMPSFKEDKLEQLLMDEIVLIKFNDKHWEDTKKNLFHDETKEFLDYEIRTLRSELTKNEIRLDELYEDWKDGVIDAEFFKSRSSRVKERQQEVKDRLAELEEEREHYDEKIGKAIEILDSLKNWEKIFEEASQEKRNHLLRLLTIKISTTLRHSPDRYDETKIKGLNITFTPEVRELFVLGLLEMDSKIKRAKLDEAVFNSPKLRYG